MIKKIGLFFLCFPLVMFVIETLFFIIGWHVNCFAFIFAFILVIGYILRNTSKKIRLKSICWFVGITLASIFIGANVYDASYDGQWYHSSIIKLMNDGWNPFYHPILQQDEVPYYTNTHIWVSHYAKGMETIEAGIVALTGNLESGKTLNIFLAVSLFCFVFDFIGNFNKLDKGIIRFLVALTTTLNPVLVNQMMTHYIDYTCYVFVTIGLVYVYNIVVKKERSYMLPLLLMGFFVPTIKFNIAFWFVVILLVFIGLLYHTKRIFDKILFRNMAISVVAGFLVGAFNPYITNTVIKHNPVYPLIGEDKIDIMSIVTPQNIEGKCVFYQVNYSLAANPYSSDSRRMGNDSFFKIAKDDLMDSPKHDLQLGGFGEFFFEAMLILFIVFVMLKKDRRWKVTLISILFLYLCLFILPSGFLARYVPFFYLVPCILIGYILNAECGKYKRGLTFIAMVMLLVNSFLSLVGGTVINVQQRVQTDYIVSQIKSKQKPVYVYSQSIQMHNKLKEVGCKYQNGNIFMDKKNKNQIDLIGVKMQTNLMPEDFNPAEMPLLMQKVGMFQLKFSKP